MDKSCNEILERLPEYEEAVEKIKETLLTNLIMISEIPAPTFEEQDRNNFLLNRFTEYNLLNCSSDEKGNALGIIPGKSRDSNILVIAHMDTIFPSSIDHTITVQPDKVIGPGVGDNGLGLATLATLPMILDKLGIEFESNLILMGSSKSLGNGDIEGLRFFMDNFKKPITAGICLEGVKLGRLSYSSIGMLRGELNYEVPEEYDWTRFNSVGAIVNMNEMINKILEIPLPRKPKTSIVLGSIRGGTSYNTIPTKASLKFEVRSESEEMVEDLAVRIRSLADEMTSMTGAMVNFIEMARRRPGGTQFSHSLNKTSRAILERLGVTPRLSPSTSEVSAFIDKNIPAVTIGLTDGEHLGEMDEMIQIEPMKKGIAQLIALLQAVDKGYCNED
ncbi:MULTISPECIES: peptidase dimerization domain-containing protein [unclassified Oceanispirochaeta]|uniref:peptidase dimerization domain-containing protein n=1 Tax=unclassified Oceanispirochaeta TaxID=2635722 RepID=UPI000E08D8EF|nr:MULTISPECIES: peptidase dimerization domain-containing protein [unclassified Oceanispirochaeta]MBF9015601.1 peptidase dimerization domain-containing protein [Oceanispirochaeta sp. M2]NPD73375.1 peptidase dimerization domain-containing protein [Oceanispirochaeta sp. M1]RDG30852.1 peptidase [Oceanispirochaeta sp. M1]